MSKHHTFKTNRLSLLIINWSVRINMMAMLDSPCEGLLFGSVGPVVAPCLCLGLVSSQPSWSFLLPRLLTTPPWPPVCCPSQPAWLIHRAESYACVCVFFKSTSHRPAWPWWRKIVVSKVQASQLNLFRNCTCHQHWACEGFLFLHVDGSLRQ